MKKQCIIIDYEYPFMTSEPFLENEMPYLSNAFERVLIFSCDPAANFPQTRKLPKNVVAYPLGTIKHRKVFPLLKGLFAIDKEYPLKISGLKRKLYCAYYRGRYYSIFKKILKIVKKEGISLDDTVIYSFWMTYLAMAAISLKKYALARGYKNVSVVSRCHGHDIYDEHEATFLGFIPYHEAKIEKLDGVFPCSNNGLEYLQNRFPNHKDKMATAYLGTIDHGTQQAQPEGDVFSFVTCSSFYQLKRMKLFAKAFCNAAAKDPSLRWICIGDGDEYEEVKEIVHDRGADENVVFVGRIPNSEVITFYRTHYVCYFANVSISEGLPVSIMEAESFGIPICATAVGGVPEIVNNQNGVLLPKTISEDELSCVLLREAHQPRADYLEKRRLARRTWELTNHAQTTYQKWCSRLLK